MRLHRRCAGLDVHKAEVVACARVFAGRKVVREVRRFGTTTRERMALAAWLESLEVTHVAMKASGSTGNGVAHSGSRFDADPGQCAARAQRTGGKSEVKTRPGLPIVGARPDYAEFRAAAADPGAAT